MHLRVGFSLCGTALLTLLVMGCGQADGGTGLSPSQAQMTQNVSAWAKRTDGDWNKLSASEKATMINSVGSEGSARMVLQMKAHPPTPIAPGPPPGVGQGGPHPDAKTPPPGTSIPDSATGK